MDGRVENQNNPETMRLTKDEGDLLVPGQRFVLFSYIGPAKCVGEDGQTKDFQAIKFRGAFANQDEAERHMKHLAQSDPYFDVYMCDAGAWLVCPPPSRAGYTMYHEQHLNEIFSKYKSDAVKAKQDFEARQKSMIDKSEQRAKELADKAKSIMEEEEEPPSDQPDPEPSSS